MRIIKRLLIFSVVLVLVLAGLFVLLIGPWPVYTDAHYQQSRYYKRSLAAIDAAAASLTVVDQARSPLMAGWAEREITPEVGHPMAGYGGRPNNKLSQGILEPLFVRALALHDGANTVVLVGSDMLQTLPNLLALIEPRVTAATTLTNRHIMYTSSHTHAGPGGLAPGFVAELSYGPYDSDYLHFLAECFSEAIIDSVKNLAPARFAHGAVEAPEYIRNRSRRDAPVDATLSVAVVEHVDCGRRLYLARYSAHCTVFGEEMLELNNDYAGAFQRAIYNHTGMPLLFMAGAVGSMRPYPPGPPLPEPWTPELALGFENAVESALVREGKKTLEALLQDQRARAEAMGEALAERFLSMADILEFETDIAIAALSADYTPPPAQVRISSPRWRLSPFVFHLLGIPKTGRLQAARIGSMFLIGMPYDFSGETSQKWRTWAAAHDVCLWATSFSGAYLGYLSPDKYYHQWGEGFSYNNNYEIGQMNWFGPNQEAYVTDLFHHAFHALPAAR